MNNYKSRENRTYKRCHNNKNNNKQKGNNN